MKTVFIASLLYLLTTSTFGQDKTDFVVWGIYCGECTKNCATFYKITVDGQIYIDKSDKYFKIYDEPYSFHGKKKSNKEWDEYQWLLNEIPYEIYNYSNGEIGEPDHFDQCGFYLQIKKNGEIRYWQIDPLETPDELKAFVDKLYKE